MRTPLVAIIGPTAIGKTDAAIHVAQRIGSSVISADSRQIYAGFNVGTAKPSEAWRTEPHAVLEPDRVAGIAHYLLNIARATKTYTLASWQAAALAAVDRLHEQSVLPLLVGGTMLYVDSVLDNFSLPQVPPNQTLRDELAHQDVATLYKKLLAHDPAAAQFIEPHHTQRIIRALEVIATTQQPFSHLRQKHPSQYRTKVIGLFSSWDMLEENITRRAAAMLKEGLLEEVRTLQQRFGAALPLLSTMNYREAALLLAGSCTQQQALDAMVRANMRYARRQMSWWKRRSDIAWYEPATSENIVQAITEFLSAKDQ